MANETKKSLYFEGKLKKAKSFTGEFKKFALRGNVIDLAVGVIIGGAFGKIVTSLVNDLFMPLILLITGNTNLKDLSIILKEAQGETAALRFSYGNFLQTVIDFLIVAFFIFLFIRFINRFKKKEEEVIAPPPALSTQEVLLTEIRDELMKIRQ